MIRGLGLLAIVAALWAFPAHADHINAGPCTTCTVTSLTATAAPGVQLGVVGGGSLPTCTTALKGAMAVVNNALSPTYNGTLTATGAVVVPVMCNGTNWVTH